MQPLTIVALGVAAVGFTLLSLFNKIQSKQAWRNKSTEPPGPTLVPWVGRIHDLPIEKMWLKFAEWADTYGPLYRTQMLGDNFIIITDEKIAEDLLVKRAKIYSDRPQIRSLFDAKSTHGSMEYLPLMGKNAHWARQRKFAHSTLVDAGNARYNGAMYHETKRWLNRLLDEPDDFSWSLEDMCSKVMTQLSWDDPDMSEYCTKSAWGLLTQMSPAGPITNVLSPLWHLPFSINPWKIRERSRHDEQQAWWMERLLKTRKLMEIGEARPSFMQKYLDGERTGNLTGDYEASSAIGMVALVGIFTVAGPLYYFLLAMLYHPEWQRKIQKEIDEQCCGRMPELTDTPNLPILRACIKETMRWRPNVPTGVAHEVEADDFYNGYFIPKGTRILPLDYAFQRNATKYPDPENYRPERWLEAGWPTFQEPLTEFPTIMGMTSFGYGQRACLGQGVTRDETIVACGGLLWGFNLVHKQGKNGQPIKPDLNASNSLLIVKPDPYELAFEPRSEARRQEMRANWAQSDAQDKKERADFLAAARAARAPKTEATVDVSDKPLVDTAIETPVVLPPVVAVS